MTLESPRASRLDIERDRKAAKKLLKDLKSDEPPKARAAAARLVAAHPAFRHLREEAVLAAKPTLRDAQLVIAREYGFKDWNAWKQHVAMANGDRGALLAAARQAIAACDGAGLEQLLTSARELVGVDVEALASELLPKTLAWVNFAGEQEAYETRSPCDRVLLDAGAELGTGYLRSISTGCTRQLELFRGRGLVPHNLRTAAAAGDFDAVRRFFDAGGNLRPEGRPSPELTTEPSLQPPWPDPSDTALVLADAVRFAARHNHRAVVEFLLERARQVEPEIASKVDTWTARDALVAFLCDQRRHLNVEACYATWELVHELRLRVAVLEKDAVRFRELLHEEPAFLGPRHLAFQVAAIEAGVTAIARALLAAEPALLAAPEELRKVLDHAALYGDREMVKLLLPLIQPRDDLPTWAALGNIERVRGFFDGAGKLEPHPVELPAELAGPSESYRTLLHALGLACMNEELEIAEYLLERGADINGPWSTHQPATILHEMAAHGKMRAIAFLLDHGADPGRRDAGYGALACGWAGVFGQPETGAYLLERTARVNLFAAIDLGAPQAVERLIAQGHDVDERIEFGVSKGQSPLFLAVALDKPELVELLLAHGADVRARDHENRGPLHRIPSGAKHALEIARLLVARGADPRAADNEGRSAIAHARAAGQEAVAAFLEEPG